MREKVTPWEKYFLDFLQTRQPLVPVIFCILCVMFMFGNFCLLGLSFWMPERPRFSRNSHSLKLRATNEDNLLAVTDSNYCEPTFYGAQTRSETNCCTDGSTKVQTAHCVPLQDGLRGTPEFRRSVKWKQIVVQCYRVISVHRVLLILADFYHFWGKKAQRQICTFYFSSLDQEGDIIS